MPFIRSLNSDRAVFNSRKSTPDIGEEKVERVFMTTRTENLKRILKTYQNIGLIVLLSFVSSCTPDLSDDPIPYQPFDDIVINLGLPAYLSLSTDQGYKYVSGGIKG